MKIVHINRVALAGLVGIGALLGAAAIGLTAQLIKVDGSSTVFPITEAVAEEFQKAKPGVRVTVGISGTGGGFKKFCNGETDISDASRPIKLSEVEMCFDNKIKYIELPIAFDGLAVMVNPQNTWATSMTVKELKKLWEPAAQKDQALEPASSGLAGQGDSPLWHRRGFRNLRLLHRCNRRQGAFQSGRLHGERGRQCSGTGYRQ
jgi:ABC-type phosphate transport system substrate-binding protein